MNRLSLEQVNTASAEFSFRVMSSFAGEKQDGQDPQPYTRESLHIVDPLRRPVSTFDPPKLRPLPKKFTLAAVLTDVKSSTKKRNFDEVFEDGGPEPEPITQSEAEDSTSFVSLKRASRAT